MASTIILSDNGASSGSAGLKQTAGNDGVLILQTATSGGTATNAVYVDTTQLVGLGTTPSAKLHLLTTGNTTADGIRLTLGSEARSHNIYSALATGRDLTIAPYRALTINTGSGTNEGVLTLNAYEYTVFGAGSSYTEAARLKSGGTFILQGGSTSATGTGISFPATQSASSDANTLDDYEEGTWTPTFTATGYTFTQGTSAGVYTRIGRVVTWSCYVTVTYSSGSGTVVGTLAGLPFTSSSSNANYGGVGICPDVGSAYITSGGYGQMAARVGPSSSSVYVFAGGGGLGLKTAFNWAGMTANTEFEFSGTYVTNT